MDGNPEFGPIECSAARYHADEFYDVPTLSSGIANTLYAETPKHAWTAHPRLGGVHRKASREMNLGSVAHEIVLGKGGGYIVSPFDDYRTKAAMAWRDETVQSGKTPIKLKDYEAAEQMAKALDDVLFDISGAETAFQRGRAEAVVLWKDIGGPLCRAMLDWWDADGPVVYDLKTGAGSLDDRSLGMRIAGGMDLQAAFYMRGLETVLPEVAGRIKWRWVFLETEAPFEARVVEMDGETRAYGDRKAALAIELWRRCLAENRWPGYSRAIGRIEYPAWAANNVMAREMVDDDATRMRTTCAPIPAPSHRDELEEFTS
jgi:hypothetical protein